MNSASDDQVGPKSVAIVDAEVPDAGWQALDLDIGDVLSHLGDRQAAPVHGPAGATHGAWSGRPVRSNASSALILSFADGSLSPAGSSPAGDAVGTRVPRDAFVSIGRPPVLFDGPARPAAVFSASPSANDNVARQTRERGKRSVWRDIFFLVVLFATVAGAFWSGRVHGLQRVIVVPAPSTHGSVIT